MSVARLIGARRNKGLTLREAADQIGVSWKTLQRAEAGESIPFPKTAFQIASFYELKVTDIWPVEEPTEAAA